MTRTFLPHPVRAAFLPGIHTSRENARKPAGEPQRTEVFEAS